MTTIRQIADQLAQALRKVLKAVRTTNTPETVTKAKEILEQIREANKEAIAALAIFDSAVAQDNQCLSAEDAAEQWLRSTARLAGPHGVSEEQEHLMRLGYENGYRDAVALGAPDTRVEELERTVAASQCLCGLLKTALAGAGMERSIERAERTAAELLKEEENG